MDKEKPRNERGQYVKVRKTKWRTCSVCGERKLRKLHFTGGSTLCTDCLQEGIRTDGYKQQYYCASGFKYHYSTPREAFAVLIDKTCGKGTWKSNPWVFVYQFELIR